MDHPNREQAGFRKSQGGLLQVFAVMVLISYAKNKNKDLMIIFMDYAKAFDYANRANIISDLISNRCGKKFTEAIAKMFESTTYIPLIGKIS